MKKVLHDCIVNKGIFDFLLFGQANKALAYSILPKGVQHHCSKSFFYKCLAQRSADLLKDKEKYLLAAELYFDVASKQEDPLTGAPRVCVRSFILHLGQHNDPVIREFVETENIR